MKDRFAVLLRLAVHGGALLPLAALAWDFFTGGLTANPIQAATQRTGRTAAVLLLLTLACSPLAGLLRFPALRAWRKALGLYAFLYAACHLYLYAVLDYGLDWSLLADNLFARPFIAVGAAAFAILAGLALTSLGGLKRIPAGLWRGLHRLVYAAALLVALHYAWALKGSLFSLSGNILLPGLYGLAVILLLGLRLGPVRRRTAGFLGRAEGINGKQPVSPEQGGGYE